MSPSVLGMGEKSRQVFREQIFSYVTLDNMWYMYNVDLTDLYVGL